MPGWETVVISFASPFSSRLREPARHGIHACTGNDGGARAGREPSVGQAHALQVWPARGRDRSHLSRIRVRDLLSCQSLMPVAAGKPRYENWVHWLMEGFRCRLGPSPLPWLGTSPSATFLFRP